MTIKLRLDSFFFNDITNWCDKLFLSKIWHLHLYFDKYRIVLLASEGCLNRDHVDLLLLNPASAAGIYPTRMTLMD
jgi:hypothetical protein